MSLPSSTLILAKCVFTNTHVITHHNVTQSYFLPPHIILGWLLSNLLASSLTFQNWTIKCHKLYITGIPFSTSIQPSMSRLSHITLSLAIPLPFPQLVTCPQHPKPGRGSPNFCGHPLIFLLLSVVEIPSLGRSLVAEQSIGRNWPLFERGFSARSHPFLTKRISRLQSPWRWLSGDMFGSAGRC